MKAFYFNLKICTFAALFCSIACASTAVGINAASSGKISGKILNADSQNRAGNLNVSLYSLADSTLLAGTLTDTEGNFGFFMLENGTYYIEIGNPGYKTQKIEGVHIRSGNKAINLGEITYSECRFEKRKKK